MKRVAIVALCVLLCACFGRAPEPHQDWTMSAHSEQAANKGWDAARAWLLLNGFGVRDKPNSNTIEYVLKSDQEVVVLLHRDPRYPTLVGVRVSESGKALGPKARATYDQVTAAVAAALKEKR